MPDEREELMSIVQKDREALRAGLKRIGWPKAETMPGSLLAEAAMTAMTDRWHWCGEYRRRAASAEAENNRLHCCNESATREVEARDREIERLNAKVKWLEHKACCIICGDHERCEVGAMLERAAKEGGET